MDWGTKNEHRGRAVNEYGRESRVTAKFGAAERKTRGKPYGPVLETRLHTTEDVTIG